MGLDMGCVVSKSMADFEGSWGDWADYKELVDNGNFYDEYERFLWPDRPVEVWYARKFWDMINKIPELKKIAAEPSNIGRIKKDVLKRMIEFYAFHPDYFDGFNGLPQLCELYQMYDDIVAQGKNLYFWVSY